MSPAASNEWIDDAGPGPGVKGRVEATAAGVPEADPCTLPLCGFDRLTPRRAPVDIPTRPIAAA